MSEKPIARVLIVDDSTSDREQYRRILLRNTDYEFRFVECENGAEGLQAFKKTKPDCLLLDYNLPDIDGIEFLSAIQADSPSYEIPVVVMLTGQGTSNVAVEAMRRGATDYLVKNNINSETLNTSVNAALAKVSQVPEIRNQKFNVLIIDDSEDDRQLYKRLLYQSSYNRFDFIEVSTGQEGLQEWETSGAHCILLDYNLPDFDGLDFLAQLTERQVQRELAMPVVVMLTGVGSEAIAVEAMKRGAQDYLVKQDLTRETLHRSVALAMEKHSLVQRLSEKEREFEQFCYAVAHDLQAPLRRSRQFCSLLYEFDHTSKEEREEYIGIIDGNIGGLQTHISELLSYYSIDKNSEQPSKVSLNELFEHLLIEKNDVLNERDASVKYGDLPVVKGYEKLLRMLFWNLIENGIKFNQRSAPSIEIHTAQTARFWQFEIRDNGIGIPKDRVTQIFKPFHRLHAPEDYPGTGLGLAICVKIVRQHSGHLWVEESSDAGTLFCVQLAKDY